MSFILAPWKDAKPTEAELHLLQGDSQLIIVAGSDTTAFTLTSTLRLLLSHPTALSTLHHELTTALSTASDKPITLSNQHLHSLPYLNGVINEALRLYPPAGILQRITPPGGIFIGERHVPGETTVFSEKNYANALAFRPERWFAENTEMIKEPSAFAPFSTGPYNCIGKPVALMNLRTTLARLVLQYEIAFAEGENGHKFERDMRTNFVTRSGAMWVRFRRR
ncbi:MAG: hypothetical protein Q9182_006615 [Xanthomendoza sp. 2 TL-2023]